MGLTVGSCSWKFPSWQDIVYSSPEPPSFLAEYARKYRSVEVDQWFWSLFGRETIKLPNPREVARYLSDVGPEFTFGIKAPNSITLTHLYKQARKDAGKENPHFLSSKLTREFLERIVPMRQQVVALMLQFEYLNKRKMEGLSPFLKRLEEYFSEVPPDWPYALEIRNPNYLKRPYFSFLKEHRIAHVFAHGYYMPPAWETYRGFRDQIGERAVLRLLGWDRSGIEKITGKRWNSVVDPKDEELDNLAWMVGDLLDRGVDVAVYVNNHYEGSAPITIERLLARIGDVDRDRD